MQESKNITNKSSLDWNQGRAPKVLGAPKQNKGPLEFLQFLGPKFILSTLVECITPSLTSWSLCYCIGCCVCVCHKQICNNSKKLAKPSGPRPTSVQCHYFDHVISAVGTPVMWSVTVRVRVRVIRHLYSALLWDEPIARALRGDHTVLPATHSQTIPAITPQPQSITASLRLRYPWRYG